MLYIYIHVCTTLRCCSFPPPAYNSDLAYPADFARSVVLTHCNHPFKPSHLSHFLTWVFLFFAVRLPAQSKQVSLWCLPPLRVMRPNRNSPVRGKIHGESQENKHSASKLNRNFHCQHFSYEWHACKHKILPPRNICLRSLFAIPKWWR